jgi:A1 cistron-splicing factor AAR2
LSGHILTITTVNHGTPLQALKLLLDSVGNDYNQVLGELQYSFVCFLIGHVYDAFDQWKQLVALLCTCDAALRQHPTLFHELIGVLHFQLRETPEDFFVDIVSRDNFLTHTLQSFFTFCDAASIPNPNLNS